MNFYGKAIKKYKNAPVPVKASFWFMVSSVLQKGVSVITTPIFTRLLSSAEYGKFNVFTSWQGIITALVILTLPWGVFEQGLVKFYDERKTFTSSLLGLMTTLCAAGVIIYLLFQKLFNNVFSLSTPQMLSMFSLIWSSSVFSFWAMGERVDYRYRKLIILTLAVTIVKPIVGIIVVSTFQDKVTARIISLAVVEMVFFLTLFISMMLEGRIFFSRNTWKYAIGFNIPLIPHYLSQRLLNNADRIMIERMVNAEAAGIYSLAYSLALLMQMVNTSVRDTLSPWTYKKIKSDKVEDIPKVAYPAMAMVAVFNLLLIAFAPEIVRIFAPIEYYDAIWIIPPVTMSVYFMFLYFFFADFEFYFEKTKIMSVATVIGAILNIVLNYIFIRIFGYYAAGYTTLLCYILYAVLHYIFMSKICNKEFNGKKIYDVKIIIGISIAFMIVGFLITAFYAHIIIRYSFIALIVICIFIFRHKIENIIIEVRTEAK